MRSMIDGRILVTVASIVAAFGLTTLMFRVQRELRLRERSMPTWLAWSDWLLIAATVGCMLLVVLPLVTFATLPTALTKVPSAVCAGASILVVGYIFGILAHYRLLFWHGDMGTPHVAGEPVERVIVVATALLALGIMLLVIVT